MTRTRERDIIGAFVTLATNLADGADVVETLTGLTADCVTLLDVSAAGLLLADARGVLHLVAASSEEATTVELLQLQRAQGPCLDCFHTGQLVSVPDLTAAADRWPLFVPAAQHGGFASVHAVPLRLRENVLGALNLFGAQAGALHGDDLDLAQALAHVASVALVQEKAAGDKDLIVTQLTAALASRVVLEQAKGVLAERGGIEMDAAFAALRLFARDNNQRLSAVAAAVAARTLHASIVLDHAVRRSRGRHQSSSADE